jgi:hypothetical protein
MALCLIKHIFTFTLRYEWNQPSWGLGCSLKISVAGQGGADGIKLSVNDRHTYPPFIRPSLGQHCSSPSCRARFPHMNKSDVYPSPKLTVRIKTEWAATELLRSLALHLFNKESLGFEYRSSSLIIQVLVDGMFSCGVFNLSRRIKSFSFIYILQWDSSWAACIRHGRNEQLGWAALGQAID